MSLIAERMAAQEHAGAADFVDRNAALFGKAFLTAQFSSGRVTSETGRRVALLPRDQFV